MFFSLLNVLSLHLASATSDVPHGRQSCEPVPFTVQQALNGTRLTSSSGDFRIDSYLAPTFARVADITGLYPSILFDTGASTRKLFAVPPQPTPNNPDRWGRVILGVERLRREVHASDHGIYGAVGAVVHELSHVLQFNTQSTLLKSELVCELHADFMAGYFLGVLFPDLSADRLTAFVRAAQAASDQAHGTPTERERAIRAGYSVRAMTPTDAFASGEIFLLTGGVPSPPAP